jgi:hypothetical protein
MAARALLKPFARTRDADAIRAEIAVIDAAESARIQADVETTAKRQELVIEGDVAALEAHDARSRRAAIEAEVGTAHRERLVQELADVEATAVEAQRLKRYQAAARAAEEARKLYRESYPRLARELADLLGRLDVLNAELDAVNADLPMGKVPLSSGEPSRGREMTAGYETQLDQIYRIDTRTGREIFAWKPGDNPYIEERVRKIPSWVPPVYSVPHVPISAEVRLPGLAYGDAPFWPAADGK